MRGRRGGRVLHVLWIFHVIIYDDFYPFMLILFALVILCVAVVPLKAVLIGQTLGLIIIDNHPLVGSKNSTHCTV